MTSPKRPRDAVVRTVTTVYAGILLTVMVVSAVSGIVDPQQGAQGFGVPATDDAAALYFAVYRDRNLVLAAVGFAFLFLRMWSALAILATAAVTLPLYDMLALLRADEPVSAGHPLTFAALVVLAALLWTRVRRAGAVPQVQPA
ncbi:DUF4267 domain-containing protein [Pseudonocardia pini]|uniref:DUF4267 domain-containing protein n=1 Tax=Pseudonocardia pini TaxID=2758030 RepID=UPI0015F0C4C3|nr:DUF4267 domain-containing protein [Pseudonocardia pini]